MKKLINYNFTNFQSVSKRSMDTAVIFGSGTCPSSSKLYKSAYKLGEFLASKGYNIANGGYFGVMEASAKGASLFNVERIGVVFRGYKSNTNQYLTKVVETKSYLERLSKLIELGNVYFVFEGESGTLLEFFALLALTKRGEINKKVFCIGKKWIRIKKFFKKQMEFLDNVPDKKFYFFESLDELIEKLI
ncbi:MAG: LOG family protein [Ignavibacteria bacterium]|nr:LOG family protein [Ignavibacteria bacterium]